jgi:hypothetical protein
MKHILAPELLLGLTAQIFFFLSAELMGDLYNRCEGEKNMSSEYCVFPLYL